MFMLILMCLGKELDTKFRFKNKLECEIKADQFRKDNPKAKSIWLCKLDIDKVDKGLD